MGIAPDAVPVIPAPAETFGVNINKPKPQKALTSDECIKLFGAREAVLMNFIPQMLTALALNQTEKFIGYCRDHRLEVYKRHNRELRRCIDEYNKGLEKSYGRAWRTYVAYLAKLRQTVELDLFKCWCTFTNEAARQYVGKVHNEIPARITLVRMLLLFVEDFDKGVDKLIASRTKRLTARIPDPQILLLSALCLDIAETFGQKMEITDNMSLCVKVLANRCHKVAVDIITEEDAARNDNN